MKARFWVVGNSGGSLRESLNLHLSKDRSRSNEKAKFPVCLKKAHAVDRPEGWSSIRSRYYVKGAVRYRWNNQLKILECWAVTKGGNRPFRLMGEFVESILSSQGNRVRSIHIEVG
jgi:hypothetical protein